MGQLAIFLAIQTILHPHNVRQPHISPDTHPPSHPLLFTFCKNLAGDEKSMGMQVAFMYTIMTPYLKALEQIQLR